MLLLILSESTPSLDSIDYVLIISTTAHEFFNSNGIYKFYYDTGEKDQSFREESRDNNGKVRGRYGFVGPDHVLYITDYEADVWGYRAFTRKLFLVKDWTNYLGKNQFFEEK